MIVYPGRSAVSATSSQETSKFISQSVSTADQSSAGFLSRRINARHLQVQSLVFLGALIMAFTMTLVVPLTKFQELQCEVQALKKRKICAIQELSALLGQMTQMSETRVGSAPLQHRSLQKQHIWSIHRYGILARRQYHDPINRIASQLGQFVKKGLGVTEEQKNNKITLMS